MDIATNETTAALLIIGAEVLSGKVCDSNSPYLCKALRKRGVQVVEIRTIGDDINTIANHVKQLAPTADYLFTTGGIGPTHDDLTIEGVALACGVPVVQDAQLAQRLQQYFSRSKPHEVQAALKMANIPYGAEVVIHNDLLAPVLRMANITILPGVPIFMQRCFESIAHTIAGMPFSSDVLYLNVYESHVANILSDLQKRFTHVVIGSYPNFEAQAHEHVKVTFDGRDAHAVAQAVAAAREVLPADWIIQDIPPGSCP